MTSTLWTFAPDEAPDAVTEAGLADLWRRLDHYRWPSPMFEGQVRRELIQAAKVGGLNATAIDRSIASIRSKLPTSLGPVPGIATRLRAATSTLIDECRRLVDASRKDDEASEVAKTRRLGEVKWIYTALLAELDRLVDVALKVAKDRVAATPAAVDRHGERFTAAVAEISMLLSSGRTEPLLTAWQRAVDRRQRPELEAWSGVPSILRGWHVDRGGGSFTSRNDDGSVTIQPALHPADLADRIDQELRAIIDEIMAPSERAAVDARRQIADEEQQLEVAYIQRPGLVALVQ